MIRSFGMSSVSMVSMSIVISPGIGTSSGEEPPKTCIGASSNPSTKSSRLKLEKNYVKLIFYNALLTTLL